MDDCLRYFRSDVKKAISKHEAEPLKVLGSIPYKVGKFGQYVPPGAPLHTIDTVNRYDGHFPSSRVYFHRK